MEPRQPYEYNDFQEDVPYSVPERVRIADVGVLPRAVILAPTRELASQIHLEARKICFGSDIKTVTVYGGPILGHN
jgi:superfamily II DNA/RNA helicase